MTNAIMKEKNNNKDVNAFFRFEMKKNYGKKTLSLLFMYKRTVVIEKYAGVRHRHIEEARENRNAREGLCGPPFSGVYLSHNCTRGDTGEVATRVIRN
jgi:hypothetical protein